MSNLAQMRDGWNRYAVAYDDAFSTYTEQIANQALEFADVSEGRSFLDVAAGGGALSIPAATLGAEVLAVDFSTAMVELLSQKARKSGLANLNCKVMDGTALDLEDGSFDVVGSQFGVMLFPDRAAGMAELARVTRHGGRGIVVAFGAPQRVAFMALYGRALKAALPPFEPKPSPMFSLQDPEQMMGEMKEAGYKSAEVHTTVIPMRIVSAAHLWDAITSAIPAIAAALSELDSDTRAVAKRELIRLVENEYGQGAVELPSEINIGVGTK